MNLTPQSLAHEVSATGFGAEPLDKVFRLMALLDALNSHPFLKTRIALKGGTALNLFHFNVPRLSVDIDLNYVGAADRETMLAERKLARSGAQLEQILAACWEETLDVGPYDFGDQAIDWGKVLQGDRFFAMLQIRVLSYGPEYAFSVPCENRGCRARIEWELDLRELPVTTLCDESRAAFLAGNRFETVLPDANRKVSFRLLTGADERRIAALHKTSERPITTMLGFRLNTIDGVEPRDKALFIEDLAMADVTFLLGEFDRVDCGVETEIEVECAECFGTTRVELPFEKGFFLPSKRKLEEGHRIYIPSLRVLTDVILGEARRRGAQ